MNRKYSCGDCSKYRTEECEYRHDPKLAHSAPILSTDNPCKWITIATERDLDKPVTYTPTALTLKDKIRQILTGNPGATVKQVELLLRSQYHTYSHADARLRELRQEGTVQSVRGSPSLQWYLT